MNENNTPIGIKEKEECPNIEVKPVKRDTSAPIIAAISVFMLIFAITLALAITLINAEWGKTLPETPDTTQGQSVLTPPDSIQSNIENNRDKPTLQSHKNTAESTSQYRPKDSASAVSIGDAVSSKAALLVDVSSGNIIAQKSLDTPLQIASMTKVMTLIVACDYIMSSDMMYATVDIKYSDRLKGYNKVFVNEGHEITEESVYVIDLLYGLILFSGADCAYGLAEGLAGSEAAFVEKMNEKAKAIGMNNTTFTNCVGKDDGGKNVSTVRDTATMFIYAIQNPLCREILSESRWACVGKYDLPMKLYNGNVASNVHEKIKNTGCGSVTVLGGKSGNEDLSGYCLVSFGKNKDGREYVCVTAGHPSSSYTDTGIIYTNYAG